MYNYNAQIYIANNTTNRNNKPTVFIKVLYVKKALIKVRSNKNTIIQNEPDRIKIEKNK